MKKLFISLPVVFIFIISIFLFIYLLQGKDPSKPPSAFLNKNLPAFNAESLFEGNKNISNLEFKNKLVLINFFASWCIPCKAEHPLFFQIKKNNPDLIILGINHKDIKNDAISYLDTEGNPYDYIGIDSKGLIGLEFGVFGLPETFIVNKSGKIIFKYLGPLTKEIIKNEIQPLF
jgi:cytochrome c biogenesis protein CcmG, thiol:disulfide interchange protein DsbE